MGLLHRFVGHLLFLACLVLLALPPACTAAQVKAIVPEALDVAEQLCVLLTAEQKQGLSAREVADQFCKTEAQLRPFLDYVLRAKRNGVTQTEHAPSTLVVTSGCDAGASSDGAVE